MNYVMIFAFIIIPWIGFEVTCIFCNLVSLEHLEKVRL